VRVGLMEFREGFCGRSQSCVLVLDDTRWESQALVRDLVGDGWWAGGGGEGRG